MSRSGYRDDFWDEPGRAWLYRGAVERALSGKRGQQALRDLAAALDAMPVQELAAHSFQREGVCALGALAQYRGVKTDDLEPEEAWGDVAEVDRDLVSERFDIAPSMAAEIMFENDEHPVTETDAERWQRMRRWVDRQLKSQGDRR